MGNRVHVVKKQCKYGNTEAFNWKAEKFADFLRICGCGICTCFEYDYSQFELPVEDYRSALRIVRKAADNENDPKVMEKYLEKKEIDYDAFKEVLEATGYTPTGLYQIMNSFYQERDKQGAYIQFHSW